MPLNKLLRLFKGGSAKPDREWRAEDAVPAATPPGPLDPWSPISESRSPAAASPLPLSSGESLSRELPAHAPTEHDVAAPLPPAALPAQAPQLILGEDKPSESKPSQPILPLGFAAPTQQDAQKSPTGQSNSEVIAIDHEPVAVIAVLDFAMPSETSQSTFTAVDAWDIDQDWGAVAPDSPPIPSLDAELPVDLDLPDFDAKARQDLWEQPLPDPPLSAFTRYPELQAALKAERITRHLWLKTQLERDRYLDWLVSVFLTWHAPVTFRALESMASKGALNASLLQRMVDLKTEWRRRPEWWVRRTYRTLFVPWSNGADWNPLAFTSAPSFSHHKDGASLLTWRTARQVCLNVPGDDSIGFVEDLFDAWHQLQPPVRSAYRDPAEEAATFAFLSFIEFVRQRAAHAAEDEAASRLLEGLRLRSMIESPP